MKPDGIWQVFLADGQGTTFEVEINYREGWACLVSAVRWTLIGAERRKGSKLCDSERESVARFAAHDDTVRARYVAANPPGGFDAF